MFIAFGLAFEVPVVVVVLVLTGLVTVEQLREFPRLRHRRDLRGCRDRDPPRRRFADLARRADVPALRVGIFFAQFVEKRRKVEPGLSEPTRE
jgi:sec-independent protein translocase protein TatC